MYYCLEKAIIVPDKVSPNEQTYFQSFKIGPDANKKAFKKD